MGLLDYFKNLFGEAQPKKDVSLTDFRFYYLYGFTDKPNNSSNDHEKFNELYQLVIGDIGGVGITNSYHPYYIVNNKKLTVWAAAYVKIFTNENKQEVFANMVNQQAVYAVDTSTVFTSLSVWPDGRLTENENPVFGRYVPFIIPFLVLNSDKPIKWDTEISKGMAEKGNASEYVETVTNATRFFMPEPAFIIGFDEFDETNPAGLIEKFLACKELFSQQ